MKNKKLGKLLVACGLVAALGVGATLAYFTDQENVTNVITMGHVDITLTEPSFPQSGEVENVKPGDTIDKDPTVTVATESEDAYIRLKVKFTGLEDSQVRDLMSKNGDGSYKYLDINSRYWREEAVTNEENTYYFYYVNGSGVLTAGDVVTLFEHVNIPKTWGNEIVDKTFNIEITAEAIQADHFAPSESTDGVYGWYYEDGTTVTPQKYNDSNTTTEVTE